MQITNNTASNVYTNEYKNKNISKQTYDNSMKMKMSETDDRILGIGFLHEKNSNMHYGMCAKYADNYSEDNPVIKVTVQRPNGVEEYNINIHDINPRNATEIEMFALCNYADATGKGTGGTFGSWQTLNYYRDNASHNGYFMQTNGMDSFKSVRQDWMAMVQMMMKDYMNAGLYKQSLDGEKLLGIYERVLSHEDVEQTANQESDTKTDIIVKPDGSRVLVMTMNVGGMETNMSLEISKPTKIPNESLKQDTDNGGLKK